MKKGREKKRGGGDLLGGEIEEELSISMEGLRIGGDAVPEVSKSGRSASSVRFKGGGVCGSGETPLPSFDRKDQQSSFHSSKPVDYP